MHNLHIVVVKAFSGEDAVEIVEQEIQEWGNCNNWRTLCGAISKDGKVYQHEESRWKPATLEDLNIHINNICGITSMNNNLCNVASVNQLKKELKKEKIDWLSVKQFAQHMYDLSLIEDITKFDVWKDSYLEYQYDRFGVTHFNNENTGQLWAVYVDMHS